MKIGIMGARGSFTDEAGQVYATKEGIDATLEYLILTERVLSALEAREVDLGIFPIENSNGGIVLEALHAIAKHRFRVKKLFEIDVHQNLLVVRGATADTITTISSHDQALKQCRMYLKRKWPGIELTEYEDTAQAAADLAAGILPPTTAVIASKAAAEFYGLDVLEESIQDLKFNFTTFVVAERIEE